MCKSWRTVLPATILVLCGAVSSRLHGADAKDILDRARLAYYNFKREGLVEFRCQVVPDFDGLKADAAGEDIRKLLGQTRFEISVGSNGASVLSRDSGLVPRPSEFVPPDEQAAQRLRTTMAGLEQMLAGFFRLWTQFMGGGLLPPGGNSDLNVEELADRYLLTQKQGQFEVSISLNRELLTTEIKLASPESETVIEPHFSRGPKGYVFTGGNLKIKAASVTVDSEMTVENQEIDGFELPKTVTVTMGAIRVPLHFSDYQIKKRN